MKMQVSQEFYNNNVSFISKHVLPYLKNNEKLTDFHKKHIYNLIAHLNGYNCKYSADLHKRCFMLQLTNKIFTLKRHIWSKDFETKLEKLESINEAYFLDKKISADFYHYVLRHCRRFELMVLEDMFARGVLF